jgi:hypothetical protein
MTTEQPNGDREGDDRQMRHVDHTPPNGDGAGAVWERGGERRPDEDGRRDTTAADRERVGVADE